jgi:hypothetical protein
MSCEQSCFEHKKLSFFARDTINVFFFCKNLCINIECQDVHAQFYFRIFSYFKMCFYIVGSYAPMSRNEYPT